LNMKSKFSSKSRWLIGRRSAKTINGSALLKYIDSGLLYPEAELLRLGTRYGGWLLPTNSGLTNTDICYSAGAGEDISFDCALVQQFHCKVRIIDPTPRAIQHFRALALAISEGRRFAINNSETEFYGITAADFERLRYLPFGLADQDVELKFYMPQNPAHVSCSTVNLGKTDDYFTAQCYRLGTLMAQQDDATVALLKMDIEGAEYTVIRDMLASGLLPRILLIEFDEAHTPLDSDAGLRIEDHIRQLVREGMRCIAVEGCNATFIRIR
jgi:FkbM family methyltransferase